MQSYTRAREGSPCRLSSSTSCSVVAPLVAALVATVTVVIAVRPFCHAMSDTPHVSHTSPHSYRPGVGSCPVVLYILSLYGWACRWAARTYLYTHPENVVTKK